MQIYRKAMSHTHSGYFFCLFAVLTDLCPSGLSKRSMKYSLTNSVEKQTLLSKYIDWFTVFKCDNAYTHLRQRKCILIVISGSWSWHVTTFVANEMLEKSHRRNHTSDSFAFNRIYLHFSLMWVPLSRRVRHVACILCALHYLKYVIGFDFDEPLRDWNCNTNSAPDLGIQIYRFVFICISIAA